MWPGQQPPGGEQNPQNPNPYQQPGYHQPNPYQQPGYHQPNPYQQPQQGQPQQPQPPQPPTPQPQPPQGQYPPQGQPQPTYDMPAQAWGGPAAQPGPPEPPRKKNRTAVVAIVAAVAVVAAAGVTAAFVMKRDKGGDGGQDEAKGGKKPSATAPSSASPPAQGGGRDGEDNPRAGETAEPVIPGWKTVINPKRHDVFDVPAGWYVASPDTMSSYSKDGKPIISMTGPAYYKEDNCTVKDKKTGATYSSPLAGAGTKGAQGAKTQAEAAKNEALNWVYAVFDQDRTGDFKYTKPKKFTSDHGIKGYSSSATVTGVKKTDACSSDGKSFTVTYTDINGDYATWVLYAAKGVKDEVPDETIKKIMSTLRPLKSAS